MATISNGSNRPINVATGTLPQMGGALQNWFQPMIFDVVVKTTVNYQVVQSTTPVSFRGVWQPLSGRDLSMKSEGQRNWNWVTCHSDIALPLTTDDVIIYLGTQYRVMSQKDYSIYEFYEYHLVQDWEGSGP